MAPVGEQERSTHVDDKATVVRMIRDYDGKEETVTLQDGRSVTVSPYNGDEKPHIVANCFKGRIYGAPLDHRAARLLGKEESFIIWFTAPQEQIICEIQ